MSVKCGVIKNDDNYDYNEKTCEYFEHNNYFGLGIDDYYNNLYFEMLDSIGTIDIDLVLDFIKDRPEISKEIMAKYGITDIEQYYDEDTDIDFKDDREIFAELLGYEEFIDLIIEANILPVKEFLYKQNYYDYLKENGYYDNCDF